jgi:hypothetical protein
MLVGGRQSWAPALEPVDLWHVGPKTCALSAKLVWAGSRKGQTKRALVECDFEKLLPQNSPQTTKRLTNPQMRWHRILDAEKDSHAMKLDA